MNSLVSVAQALWHPARTLELSCYEYLTELSWLLCLRIAPLIDTLTYLSIHPVWQTLLRKQGQQQYDYYRAMISALSQSNNPQLAGIYAQATTYLTHPFQLQQMITALETLDRLPIEDLGEVYEMLLEQCSQRDDSYLIPPRALVDTMVILLQPQAGEFIYDPLAGVASFLVASDQYIKVISTEGTPTPPKQLLTIGMEPELMLQRFALMNCLLHDFRPSQQIAVYQGDSLATSLSSQVDVVLSRLCLPKHTDQIEKSLMLLRQTLQVLKPGGRAAVIVPDEVLQAKGLAQQLRYELLDICTVHTVLRLPLSTFHPHSLGAQVLFFRRGEYRLTGNTQKIWFYDLRSQLPILKQLTRQHLSAFEMGYGDDPMGQSVHHVEGWHTLTRESLVTQEDTLDYCWLEKTQYASNRKQLIDETLEELASIASLLH